MSCNPLCKNKTIEPAPFPGEEVFFSHFTDRRSEAQRGAGTWQDRTASLQKSTLSFCSSLGTARVRGRGCGEGRVMLIMSSAETHEGKQEKP